MSLTNAKRLERVMMSDLCDGYGCVNGNVVHAVGQKCYSENG